MKTKPLRLLRQKRASWLKSVFVLTCLLLSTSVAMAQTKTVTGTVTDSFNEPLIGASILVKGDFYRGLLPIWMANTPFR